MAHEFKQEQLEKDLDDLEKLITSHRMSPRGALATLSMQFIAGAYDAAPSERAQSVLAPRFTRDEAIAIVKEALGIARPAHTQGDKTWVKGVRDALEALAAAGVFVDSDPCPWCEANRDATRDPGGVCETCDGSDGRNMSDRLDAAGIR